MGGVSRYEYSGITVFEVRSPMLKGICQPRGTTLPYCQYVTVSDCLKDASIMCVFLPLRLVSVSNSDAQISAHTIWARSGLEYEASGPR